MCVRVEKEQDCEFAVIHLSSSVFSFFHADLQDAFDADWQAGQLNSVGYLNGTEDGILAYKLLIQTGSEKDPFNYSLVRFQGVVSPDLIVLSDYVFKITFSMLFSS